MLMNGTVQRNDIEVIALVGILHGISHFFHLLLPPLFPWLMRAFSLSFVQVGLLITVFYVISATFQFLAGFVVDRLGSRRMLTTCFALFVLAGVMLGLAQGYTSLFVVVVLAGLAAAGMHPADFTILNRQVAPARLGHAFSVHGLSGNLGGAVAPIFLTGIAALSGWRVAAFAAAGVGLAGLALLLLRRTAIAGLHHATHPGAGDGGAVAPANSAVVRGMNAIGMCFIYFLVMGLGLGAVYSFAPTLLQQIYGMSLAAGAMALTLFALGTAAGTALGGFLATKNAAPEKLIGATLVAAALMTLGLAGGAISPWSVSALMACTGFCTGIAAPSRDLLVRRVATSCFGAKSFGRLYGFVYSGSDFGLAVAPLLFGWLMDNSRFAEVLIAVALLQGLAVLAVLRVGQATLPTTDAPHS